MATATELIDYLGGTGAVADLLGISAPSVSDWKKKNFIPRGRVAELAIATGRVVHSPHDLAPDRWGIIWPGLGKGERFRPRPSAPEESAGANESDGADRLLCS